MFANIIGVQACGLVWRREAQVAHEKSGLAGKVVDHGFASVALMDQGLTLRNDCLHGFVFSFRNDFDAMGIVEGHLRIVLLLHERGGSCEWECVRSCCTDYERQEYNL